MPAKIKLRATAGTGVQRRCLAGEHEDSRADDGADAKGYEIDRAERASERVFPHLVGFFGEYREGLGCQESRHRSGSSSSKRIYGIDACCWLYVLYRFPLSVSRSFPEQRVKLFKNGRNQAVRIPREFELPGDDAIMRNEGERLIIEPALPQSLLGRLATLKPLDEDFPPISDPVPGPVQGKLHKVRVV